MLHNMQCYFSIIYTIIIRYYCSIYLYFEYPFMFIILVLNLVLVILCAFM